MTLAERAKAAADYLNAGDRWRVNNCTADFPKHKVTGKWACGPWPRSAGDIASQHWPTWLNHLQVVELAKAEGWTEAKADPIATELEAKTGAEGEL